jgi:hypothetical protein
MNAGRPSYAALRAATSPRAHVQALAAAARAQGFVVDIDSNAAGALRCSVYTLGPARAEGGRPDPWRAAGAGGAARLLHALLSASH